MSASIVWNANMTIDWNQQSRVYKTARTRAIRHRITPSLALCRAVSQWGPRPVELKDPLSKYVNKQPYAAALVPKAGEFGSSHSFTTLDRSVVYVCVENAQNNLESMHRLLYSKSLPKSRHA